MTLLLTITAALISLGYLSVLLGSVYLLSTRPMLRGRLLALWLVIVMAIPWALFYGAVALDIVDFTVFWRTVSRVAHFIEIGALTVMVWIVAEYSKAGS